MNAERAKLHGTEDHAESIRISDSASISRSVNTSESGAIDQLVSLIKGRPPQNEEGGDEVCHTLIERLNQEGYSIEPSTLHAVESQSVDRNFTAKDGAEEFQFQVTSAAPTSSFRRFLARFGKQDHRWPNSDLAEEGLRGASERKARSMKIGSDLEPCIRTQALYCAPRKPADAINLLSHEPNKPSLPYHLTHRYRPSC